MNKIDEIAEVDNLIHEQLLNNHGNLNINRLLDKNVEIGANEDKDAKNESASIEA